MIEKIENNVIFGLINTEANKELLEKIPHRHFLDLSVIYCIVDSGAPEDSTGKIISNSMLETAGVSEQHLFLQAEQNTRRIFPPMAAPMSDVLSGLSKGQMDVSDVPHTGMWVLTNTKCFLGASAVLYSDLLYDLAEQAGGSLYVLPSSIHEVIAVPAIHFHPDELRSIVAQVNMSSVKPDERLSGDIYYYDNTLKVLELASKNHKVLGNTERGTYGN